MKLLVTLFAACALLFLGGCGSRSPRSLEEFDEVIFAPQYASGFEIRGTKASRSTLLTIRNPWQGARDVTQHLLLLRGEETAPEGFEGQVAHAPLHHVVCMSSSHVAMFEAVGQVHKVSGVSGIDYISNRYVQEHRLCGEVRDVGYDTNINYELLAAMRPDLVLLYGVTGENTVITGKLRELGIPYLYIGDYMEDSPLGKAEWLVLVGELCEVREQGERVFATTAARYEQLKAGVAAQTDRVAPTVMLNTPYRDTWFMPSTRSFMVRLIADAGGRYIYTHNDSDSSVAVDLEEAYLLANQADRWLNVGACNTLEELIAQNPKFAAVPAVVNRQVWNNNRRQTEMGGSDFWESGVVHPDRILEDLIRLLQPTPSDSLTYYYKRLE